MRTQLLPNLAACLLIFASLCPSSAFGKSEEVHSASARILTPAQHGATLSDPTLKMHSGAYRVRTDVIPTQASRVGATVILGEPYLLKPDGSLDHRIDGTACAGLQATNVRTGHSCAIDLSQEPAGSGRLLQGTRAEYTLVIPVRRELE